MRYQFENFEFDSDHLILKKDDITVDIRHNEAKVLLLLLQNAKQVLSKDDILTRVWQDKVVTEQAVFQNISHLRTMFGAKAIRTFPKRGYQWQLPFSCSESSIETIGQSSSAPPSPFAMDLGLDDASKQETATHRHWSNGKLAVFLVLALIAITWWRSTPPDSNPSTTHVPLAYVPFVSQQADSAIELFDTDRLDFIRLNNISAEQYQTSSTLEYADLSEEHPFVLSANVRSYNDHTYLDFLLKGPEGDWTGTLSGRSVLEVQSRLTAHLSQSFIYDILQFPASPDVVLAKLSLAHQQAPDDLILLARLIQVFIDTRQFESAMAMAEKLVQLANEAQEPIHLGQAYLLQSTVLTRKSLFELSAEKLELAQIAFKQGNDLKGQSDAWYAQSWLDHKRNDYAAIKQSLLTSSRLAFDAGDKAREIEALTYLSIMANKHQEQSDKYYYLQLAENKMRAYQLPDYHFAKIPFHYAIFAESPADKEPHLKRVLEFTRLTPNYWVAQASRKTLVKYYIEQRRLEEVREILAPLSYNQAANTYLRALLAKAESSEDVWVQLAQRTFEQAQLAGHLHLTLDAALLLCDTSVTSDNFDFYRQYIAEKAFESWRENNLTTLVALQL